MAIDPHKLHSGVRSRDPKAEVELTSFLRNLVRKDYEKTLGPLAEDYLQELLIRVIEGIRRNQVEHPQFLVTYCKNVAANVRIDGLRSAARAARRLVSIEEGRGSRSREDIEGELILNEQYQTVLKLMEQLDPISREVVRRFYFERQPVRRIEREMGLTQEQLRGRKDRAVKKLRDDYQALGQRFRVIPGGKQPQGGFKAAA
jgi:RNA polymerase sigma factor (sigma-70 family)